MWALRVCASKSSEATNGEATIIDPSESITSEYPVIIEGNVRRGLSSKSQVILALFLCMRRHLLIV